MSDSRRYKRYRTADAECMSDGCTLDRKMGSVMCPKHSLRLRHPDMGPNKASDGRTTGRLPKLSDSDVAEMRRMWSQFKSQKEIAAHSGVSTVTVRKYLKQSRSSS